MAKRAQHATSYVAAMLPIGFTLSPLVGWYLDLPCLTVLLAIVVLPAAEWFFGRAKAGESAPDYHWQDWFLRVLMLSVLKIGRAHV